jgi:hypothetical protein
VKISVRTSIETKGPDHTVTIRRNQFLQFGGPSAVLQFAREAFMIHTGVEAPGGAPSIATKERSAALTSSVFDLPILHAERCEPLLMGLQNLADPPNSSAIFPSTWRLSRCGTDIGGDPTAAFA